MKKQAGFRATGSTLLLIILSLMVGCIQQDDPGTSIDELFALFEDPPVRARPFVRWWWNGDCIEVEEIRRELDVMKAAGIGGVEVNPIAHPDGDALGGYKCYDWLSPEWNERIKATIQMAQEREMIVDLIMGSGWPFGGEFLEEDQLLQGVGVKKITLEGPEKVTLSVKDLWQLPGRNFGSYNNPNAPGPELFFLQLIAQGAEGAEEMADLINDVDENGCVEIEVPQGKYDLYIGTFQKAYRVVMFGAPGSRGPVVDHYDQADVRAYLDRLGQVLEKVLGGQLGDHIRALFCDSIELSGANITDDFFEEFIMRRGYPLEPFLPLVYYHPYEGYTDTLNYDEAFNKDIRRIRYDFNKTLVELFLERFTTTFDQWANEHGMLSRYQAYGMPWLMGILDGYRLVDIPESNNWLYSSDAKSHGYWIWNKYCSSGAHLSGSKVVSSEAMTNTRGVFRMTLNMVKKNDDFNFITGINHSILHGYNYSPPEAGFPGWVRFGAYFSDQNSWWPYFRHWADYNARLSAVFQEATPVVDIAILTPEADIWRKFGLIRYPYYMNPWYHHDLWEGFSRIGIMADYINEGVIRRAVAENGRMKSEQCSYQLVIVSAATAMDPETAASIKKLAAQGVIFLFVGHMPSESPGYNEKEKNDLLVSEAMQDIAGLESVHLIDPPGDATDVTSWAMEVITKHPIRSSISTEWANENIYMVKYRFHNNEIIFISNQDEQHTECLKFKLDTHGMTPWKWDPEHGTRQIAPCTDEGVMEIRLQPLESLLLVLEDSNRGIKTNQTYPDDHQSTPIQPPWELEFFPVKQDSFSMVTDQLFSFGTHPDPRIAHFGGSVRYVASFQLDDPEWSYLDLGLQKHISEVVLNGTNLGTRWWGRHLFRIPYNVLSVGTNRLEIIYTTTLANYANSLDDNPVAKRWINLAEPEPMGLQPGIHLLKSE